MLIYPALITAIADPDDRAFMMELYKVHHRIMLAQAYKVTLDAEAASDVTQDALVRLMDKTEILTQLPRHALTAYVVLTVRNTAINHVRARTRRQAHVADVPDDVMARTMGEGGADGELLRQSDIDAVRKGLSLLRGRDAEALSMKYRENLHNDEIAQHFGIEPGSVRQLLARARKRLFEVMREEGFLDG